MFGTRRRDVKREVRCRDRHGDLDVAREVPVEHFVDPVVRVGDVSVERHRHEGDHLGHGAAPFETRTRLMSSGGVDHERHRAHEGKRSRRTGARVFGNVPRRFKEGDPGSRSSERQPLERPTAPSDSRLPPLSTVTPDRSRERIRHTSVRLTYPNCCRPSSEVLRTGDVVPAIALDAAITSLHRMIHQYPNRSREFPSSVLIRRQSMNTVRPCCARAVEITGRRDVCAPAGREDLLAGEEVTAGRRLAVLHQVAE